MRERLQVRATLSIPEPDGRIIASTSKQASIGSKSHTVDTVRMPACPEQGATSYLPELDAAIIAPAGQSASIRAESDSRHNVSMGLPDPVQGLARLLLPHPHPHFSPLAASGPVLPVAADGHCPAGIEGLSKDALTHQRPGQGRVLHLDALQIHPAQRQLRQIQPTQVPAQQPQQRHQVGRSIPLGRGGPGTHLIEQNAQLLLHVGSPLIHVLQASLQRSEQQSLLGLSHVVLRLCLRDAMLQEEREPPLLDLLARHGN